MTDTTGRALLVVYAPIAAAHDVRVALAAAGAGHIGQYSGCSFSAPGVGRFIPREGARPLLGAVGDTAEVAEERIEAVVKKVDLDAVVRAVRDAHPYEEPVILTMALL